MDTRPSLELFLILLALATLLPFHFPGSYSEQDECKQRFRCSNITKITYPFWEGRLRRACRLPGFRLLNCDGDFPWLYIPPLLYGVLEFNFSNQALKVRRLDLFNDPCPTTFDSTTLQDPYYFAPDSNDEQLTLFFGCFVDKNGNLTSLPYLSGCINLFRTGDASSVPGTNITCSHSISVPVNQTAARALKDSKAASSGDGLQEAIDSGFIIKYDPFCQTDVFGSSCIRRVRATAASPVYQEVPGGIPRPAPSPGYAPETGVKGTPAPETGVKAVHESGVKAALYIVVAVSSTGVVILVVVVFCCYLKPRSRLAGPDKENKKQSILSVLGARGTIGYIAPEVFSRNFGGVSHKSDVYSYGMMVLEMAGAKKIVEPEAAQSSENYFPDKIYEQTNSSDRPSMSKVVEMLEGSLQSVPIPPKPILFTPSFPIRRQIFPRHCQHI
ncbi:PR5-like receptor kinase [Sesamum alatum]|uniref:PR5-like receptor kinase n=1 Tax=Sesamum alatum TaxID=300844 RepID=A0AAE1YAP7_9LAMI|nr:PR5-like receptor kinase [Sesamum alatum]